MLPPLSSPLYPNVCFPITCLSFRLPTYLTGCLSTLLLPGSLCRLLTLPVYLSICLFVCFSLLYLSAFSVLYVPPPLLAPSRFYLRDTNLREYKNDKGLSAGGIRVEKGGLWMRQSKCGIQDKAWVACRVA